MDYVLSLSYGKDSLAVIGAVSELGWPLTRIIHAEVMATPAISADLPPMVDFGWHADTWIYAHTGIRVEHVRGGLDYDTAIRRVCGPRSRRAGEVLGWPMQRGPWCNRDCKVCGLDGAVGPDDVVYIGIAADEPERLSRLSGRKVAPLAVAGWTEADCMRWCADRGLVSPVYTGGVMRAGCWMCHNQGPDQLRVLRRDYPELWVIMLDWDSISPVPYKMGYRKRPGRWLRDYERRFGLEDAGQLPVITGHNWRWEWLDNPKLAWDSVAREDVRRAEYVRWQRKRERRRERSESGSAADRPGVRLPRLMMP